MRHIVYLIALCLASCGTNTTPTLQSAPLRLVPDDVSQTGVWAASDVSPTYWFVADSDSAEILFTAIGEDQICLDVGGSGVLWTGSWTIAGTTYFLASVLQADDTSRVYRYHDDDGDGALDESTETLVFDSAPMVAFITSVTVPEADGDGDFQVFALDSRCQDIWVVEDTDSDGWVDTVGATAFARSDDFNDLDAIRSIASLVFPDALRVVGSVGRDARFTSTEGTFDFEDTSGNKQADAAAWSTPADLVPTLFGGLYAGQTAIRALGGSGGELRVVEVWALDEDEEDFELLGSAVVDTTNEANVTLTRALVLDETVAVRFVDRIPKQQIVVVVPAAVPEVVRVTPERVEESAIGAPSTVVLIGQNFASDMVVTARLPSGETASMTYTYVSSTEVQVHLPAYTGDLEYRSYVFWAELATAAPEDGAEVVKMTISYPDE